MLRELKSLRDHLSQAGDCSGRLLWSVTTGVSPGELLEGTSLGGRLRELAGRSVLITTREQLASALALIELDGIARRLVICPPDIPLAHLPAVIARGGVDAIVSDYALPEQVCAESVLRVHCDSITPAHDVPAGRHSTGNQSTEWVLLTSGTTGAPKMIVHTLASLVASLEMSQIQNEGAVWGTFYDIRRYGGLQIFLRAILGKGSMVLSSAAEPVSEHLGRLILHCVTHLSGTPSHWRRALMSPLSRCLSPRWIRLSGEIADQPILNAVRAIYPQSTISHVFASTEAGVAFGVDDFLAGFPESLPGRHGDVEIRIVNDSLQIRSNRTASRYLDGESAALADEDGFVDTGDIVELRGNRYYFLGRRNGVINVGGLKVYPEEVEAVINRHPAVQMSLVQARRNPMTGSLVSADVVLKPAALNEVAEADDANGRSANFRNEILEICRLSLPPHKVPATIRCVPALRVATAGKLARQHA
jgi:acyl-CoA synthetase (AMP-forming)/AMP-acid ligase II